jgi:hypothetical protein
MVHVEFEQKLVAQYISFQKAWHINVIAYIIDNPCRFSVVQQYLSKSSGDALWYSNADFG